MSFKPVTLELLLSHPVGTTLYSTNHTNRDGSPLRVRTSGRVKTWKTRPGEFRVPVKYGLHTHGEITHHTMSNWLIDIPETTHA